MSSPLSDTRLAAIRGMKFTTGINAATGVFDTPVERELYDLAARNYNARLELLAEVDRLRAQMATASCPADCPCRSTPLPARWDKEVEHPTPGDTECPDTLVCCIAATGQPVAVWLDDEHREALGLALLLPDGDGDVDPQHLELTRENEELRRESEERLGELMFWHFEFREAMDNYLAETKHAKKLSAESESRRQAAAANAASAEVLQRQINKQASELDRLGARLNQAEAKVRAVETVKCWTNEDGRRFVFAEDLVAALGYTPTTPAAPSS